MTLEGKKIGFALTGSFCTLDKSLNVMRQLTQAGAVLTPIMSDIVFGTDTRFYEAGALRDEVRSICGRDIIHTIVMAEPIGPKNLLDALLIAPCTGNTMAKLTLGVTDTAVLMAAKATLRNGKPVIIAPSTNDAYAGSAKNIGALMNMRNVFIVPYAHDDPVHKPTSAIAVWDKCALSVEEALQGRQVQPVVLSGGTCTTTG